MNQFSFYMPAKVLYGPGQISRLHEEELPGNKALIVISAGQSAKKYGYLSCLEKQLERANKEYVVFDQVRPNPSRENVMSGALMARVNKCDFVVALGGGSVMDCGKCIALMVRNEGDIWDYSLSRLGGKKAPKYPAIPIIAITTSAGTGSEVDKAAVISDDDINEKTGIFFPSMFPSISVVDSDLMMSITPRYTAYQGMDALFHATESMINKNEHMMGEMFALKAIELISQYLPIAYKDGTNKEARANMALASSLAAYYMLCTSEHTMEHVMGSYHPKLIHGAGLIMIAKEYYSFFAKRGVAEEAMIKMAKAMGVRNPSSSQDFIEALEKLISVVGCAELKMSDEGISKEELKLYPKRLHEVLGGDIMADPILLTDDDYLEIFEKSYK